VRNVLKGGPYKAAFLMLLHSGSRLHSQSGLVSEHPLRLHMILTYQRYPKFQMRNLLSLAPGVGVEVFPDFRPRGGDDQWGFLKTLLENHMRNNRHSEYYQRFAVDPASK
jgi:hypothetical protein